MGVPVIDVQFTALTRSIVQRSARSVVAMILEDDTSGVASELLSNPDAVVSSKNCTEESKNNMVMALKSGAAKVFAVRMHTDEDGTGDSLSQTLNAIKGMEWNWLCVPGADETQAGQIAAWIQSVRAEGYLHKAVICAGVAPDCAGIVNFVADGLKSAYFGQAQDFSAWAYTPRIAGILAGTPLHRSVTGLVLEDIVSLTPQADPDADLNEGKFILAFNGTGYEIVRGVTSLTGEGEPIQFKKIKLVEAADIIAADMSAIFKQFYRGVKPNSYANKQSFVADIIAYLRGLSGTALSDSFDHTARVDLDAQKAYLSAKGLDVENMSDIDILKANTDESVFIQVNIQFLDAMEDVFIHVVIH